MPARTDEVWKASTVVAKYLEGVRGAIPLAQEQIDVMLRLLDACGRPIRRFLDLGCGDGVLSDAILRRYPDAEAVLADFSAPMLEAARERLDRLASSLADARGSYARDASARDANAHDANALDANARNANARERLHRLASSLADARGSYARDSDACDANVRDENAHVANARDSDSRDANALDANARDENSRDVNAHDAKAHDAKAHDANAHDANALDANAHDANAHDASRDREGALPDARVHLANVDYGVANWTQFVAQWAPFDAVVSGFSIHHQPDARKQEVYREIFGLLNPRGVFVNVEHVSSASPWVEHIHDELFVDHLHPLHPGQSRDEVAATYYHRPDKAANILAPVELQCQWLREIGFIDVDCYLKVFELAVFGGRRP